MVVHAGAFCIISHFHQPTHDCSPLPALVLFFWMLTNIVLFSLEPARGATYRIILICYEIDVNRQYGRRCSFLAALWKAIVLISYWVSKQKAAWEMYWNRWYLGAQGCLVSGTKKLRFLDVHEEIHLLCRPCQFIFILIFIFIPVYIYSMPFLFCECCQPGNILYN